MSEILPDLLQDYPYLWVLLIILAISAAPILTPPSWMVIASAYALDSSLSPVLLALVGASAATAGRMLLLKYSSVGRKKMGEQRKASLQRLQNFMRRTRYGYFIGTFVFALTPLPSNMLFISYGLMNARSLGIIAGFWTGRFAVYLIMVYASGYVFSPLIEILGDNLTAVILTDAIGVAMTVAVLIVDWDKIINERKVAIIKPRLF